MIGITGSHRAGKTTLAREFAKRYDIPFVRTSASEVFMAIGRNPSADYPIEERISIQETLLYAFEKQFEEAQRRSRLWISDRTPIDLASYLIADIRRSTFEERPELAEMVNSYTRRCIERTNQWFSTVMLLQPGITLVSEEGKAPCCPAYIEHLNFLQSGILLDTDVSAAVFKVPRHYTRLEDRIDCVHNAVERSINGYLKLKEERLVLGIPTH